MDVLSYALSKKYTDEQIAEQKLKVAKVEKELNDYKSVMAQVNINQEAKQKASGYGIVSLPKNAAEGQVSVTVKGNTVFNHADNGVNYANWTVTGAGSTKGVGGIHLVADGPNERADLPINLKPSTIYTLVVRIINCTLNDHWVLHNTGVSESAHTIPKTAGIHKIKFVTPSVITVNTLRLLTLAANTNGTYVDFTDVMVFEGDYTTNSLPVNGYISYGTKSTISAMRLKIVSEDESEVSTAYVVAKDEQGKIAELRSLPNGVKDEIRVSEGKLIKRVSDDTTLISSHIESRSDSFPGIDAYVCNIFTNQKIVLGTSSNMGNFKFGNYSEFPYNQRDTKTLSGDTIEFYVSGTTGALIIATAKGRFPNLATARAYFTANPTTLTYQLATPVEIPVQVSGTLVGYPSGTVYIEPYVADAGIYTDKMEVLYSDLPIKALEKISKVDFDTGLETELDITAAVIAEDKLSFTHPDLTSGDIVFFVYEHGAEGTIPETEISYYDSRYVIKDSVTDKFYKWNIAVANGQPSIELVEV